jgi:hypothetical protein
MLKVSPKIIFFEFSFTTKVEHAESGSKRTDFNLLIARKSRKYRSGTVNSEFFSKNKLL